MPTIHHAPAIIIPPPMIVAPTEPSSDAWQPDPRCRWCRSRFIRQEIYNRWTFICPTPECAARQMRWIMLDARDNLFHLPLPWQVELEEAIEAQSFSAICAGGSRAGGKSRALRRIAQRYMLKLDNWSALFLRREFPELQRNHMQHCPRESKALTREGQTVKWSNKQLTHVERDSYIEFAHCEEADDYKHYIGAEFDLVVFEQIEQFTVKQVTEISACTARALRHDWRGVTLAGENPGGPLSAFVDEMYISKTLDRKLYPKYNPASFHFIDVQLDDNPHVDPRYVDQLAALEPEKRDMYRFGARDTFPNQYFREFKKAFHVGTIDYVAHFPEPNPSRPVQMHRFEPRLGALRWGMMNPGLFLWALPLPNGQLFIEREYQFMGQTEKDVALTIRAITARAGLELGRVVGDPDLIDVEGGEDTYTALQQHQLVVSPSYGDPIQAWQRLKTWFAKRDDGLPAMIISPACEYLLKALPQLLAAERNREDVEDVGPVYAARALRYLVSSRPKPLLITRPLVYPAGSAGELMQQLMHEQGSTVLGRHNVRP